MKRAPENSRQLGFSLLEVLVAFAILALSLGVLLRIFGGGAHLAGAAEERTRAIFVAESLMASVGNEIPIQPGESAGEFDDKFRWNLSVSPFIPPEGGLPDPLPAKPYWVKLTVQWGDVGEQPHEVSLETLRLLADPMTPGIEQ